jgi:hypothetical protein
MEKYFPNSDLTRYACVAYWYQAEPHGVPDVLPALKDRVYGIEDQESRMLSFLRAGKQFTAGQAIEPLRQAYKSLSADAGLAAYRVKLALRMARAERIAGHEREAQALLTPLMEELVVPFASREHADDVLEATGSPATRPGSVRPLLADNDDGSVKRERRDGRWCVVTRIGDRRQYIYFSLPEKSDLRKKERAVIMRVTYHSDGRPGRSFTVQYDSAFSDDLAGHYHESARIDVPETAGFHTAIIKCPRAHFAGHQNSGADFRIAAEGGDVAIADIELEQER